MNISIITVVLNGMPRLEKTIESVLSQNNDSYGIEYIILDGGSTDGSVELIKSYQKRLKYWRTKKDDGLYSAMNEGINMCTGDIIGIINSDDWYENDAFKHVIDNYVSSDLNTVLYGAVRYFKADQQIDRIELSHHSNLLTRMIGHPGVFVPRVIYDKYGLFDTQYKIAADYELMIRFYKSGVYFKSIDMVLANFVEGGLTSKKSSRKEVLEIKYKYNIIEYKKYIVIKLINVTKYTYHGLINKYLKLKRYMHHIKNKDN